MRHYCRPNMPHVKPETFWRYFTLEKIISMLCKGKSKLITENEKNSQFQGGSLSFRN